MPPHFSALQGSFGIDLTRGVCYNSFVYDNFREKGKTKMNLTKQFFKYVSQNIFGLLGTSCYILADTYFISQAAGTDGVTLLNLCLPIYNFIFAIGSMIGLGAATRYAILRAQGEERAA